MGMTAQQFVTIQNSVSHLSEQSAAALQAAQEGEGGGGAESRKAGRSGAGGSSPSSSSSGGCGVGAGSNQSEGLALAPRVSGQTMTVLEGGYMCK